MNKTNHFMEEALLYARQAEPLGEVAIGAVIVCDQKIIAGAQNFVRRTNDPTAHAERVVIRRASEILKTPYLDSCDLYVTLEPCAMCAQAMAWARIRRLYFGAFDPKGGGVDHGCRVFDQSTCHHRPEVIGGIAAEASAQLLKQFFQNRRI
ncbi:MAG: nucleoside deaminase [Candidatus Nucleicultricaceae bacterium]